MVLLKIASVLFIFLTLILAIITVKVFKLKKYGLNFADLAFPFFIVEFYIISDKAFYHSLLPQLVLALSGLAIAITVYFLKKKQTFYYPKFFKFFWRAGFLLTFFMYLAMVISIFILQWKRAKALFLFMKLQRQAIGIKKEGHLTPVKVIITQLSMGNF